jgi:hypothetical protein
MTLRVIFRLKSPPRKCRGEWNASANSSFAEANRLLSLECSVEKEMNHFYERWIIFLIIEPAFILHVKPGHMLIHPVDMLLTIKDNH